MGGNKCHKPEKMVSWWHCQKKIILLSAWTGKVLHCKSIPGKVLGTIMLNKMKKEVEEILLEKQAGSIQVELVVNRYLLFDRPLEKLLLGKNQLNQLYDFRKAFISVQGRSCGMLLPKKQINIIKCLYDGSRCSVRLDTGLGEWFNIDWH